MIARSHMLSEEGRECVAMSQPGPSENQASEP